MSIKNFVASLVVGAVVASAPAHAIVFTLTEVDGGDAAMRVTVTDGTGGNADKLRFLVEFIPTTNTIGDLRGIFFDLANESLVSGTFSAIAITAGLTLGVCEGNDSINSCGGGNNVNGSGPQNFDIGIEIGNSGIGGGDDFQVAEFFLDHSSENLDVATFFDTSAGSNAMAGRITSLGLIGGARNDSSKLAGGVSTEPPPTNVSEPMALGLFGLGLLGLSLARRRRGAR